MLARLLALTTLAVASLTTTASAATTIGDSTTAPVGDPGAGDFQTTVGPGSITSVVPAGGGIITSLSLQARLDSTATSGTARILVVKGDASPFTVVSGGNVTFTSGLYQRQAVAVRIPVSGGERLAAASTIASGVRVGFARQTGSTLATGDAPVVPADGSAATTMFTNDGYAVSAAATIEPDADHDGYGDETQDSCPALASIHTGPCPADLATTITATPPTVTQGDVSTVIATVTNGGVATAVGAVASLTLPAGLQVIAASTTGGDCDGSTCVLGDIAPGASRKVVLVFRGVSVGAQTVGVVAHSSTTESSNANDGTTTTVTVTAPAAGSVAAPVIAPSPVKLCTIPSLKSKTATAARTALTAAGCAVGTVVGSKSKTAKVSSQSLPSKLVVVAGTKVGFTLKAAKKAKQG